MKKRVFSFILIALLAILAIGAISINMFPESIFSLQGIDEDNNDEFEDDYEGPDVPITGDALEQASAAALEYIGEGRVTDTEVGDEEGYYEIEITLENGNQVDVHLDEEFNILSVEADEADDD